MVAIHKPLKVKIKSIQIARGASRPAVVEIQRLEGVLTEAADSMVCLRPAGEDYIVQDINSFLSENLKGGSGIIYCHTKV